MCYNNILIQCLCKYILMYHTENINWLHALMLWLFMTQVLYIWRMHNGRKKKQLSRSSSVFLEDLGSQRQATTADLSSDAPTSEQTKVEKKEKNITVCGFSPFRRASASSDRCRQTTEELLEEIWRGAASLFSLLRSSATPASQSRGLRFSRCWQERIINQSLPEKKNFPPPTQNINIYKLE